MSASDPVSRATLRPPGVSWADLGFILVVLAGGFFFLRDAPFWGRPAYVGSAQFGDAEFWWNGALHFSQGIVADNPNLTFRMGYAAFAGALVAILGPDYRVFHQILLAIFLITAGAAYLSLRETTGRIAAAIAIVFFVFNPFTAEWLAISTSDALGLLLNLVAILALGEGVRAGLRLRPLALAGIFLACASLTRPLMTPFIVPAALVVVVAGWVDKRRAVLALAVLFAAFVLPTFAWMTFMRFTTGNFAISGGGQDAASFYAASDPQIQVWRPDMYDAVRDAAQKRHRVERPTPKQLNAEFWAMTRTNYAKHWRFHTERAWRNLVELARFTPARAATSSPASEQWRRRFKWILALALGAVAIRQRRQWSAILVVALGMLWVYQPAAGPWLVLAGGAAGLAALFFRRPGPFLWTSYWWVGVGALYLTGGTWGPPISPAQDLNALGYRLGFQFLFANDLMVAGLLGAIAASFPARFVTDDSHPFLRPSRMASRLTRAGSSLLIWALLLTLAAGGCIVIRRIVARAHATPVGYPNLASLQALPALRAATPQATLASLRAALGENNGRPLFTTGMSSGFIWNMPGQERCMLLLYQQDNVSPIMMSPRQLYVEVPRHLSDREWMNRQGAWVLRSYPNTAQVSNQAYYFEMPAVQAFVPLTADGRAYALDQAVVFPIAKAATQLVAGGELAFTGATPEWSLNSGALQFPRRFALRTGPAAAPVGWNLDLARARGTRSFSFSVQREADAASPSPHVRLVTNEGEVLWEGELPGGAPPIRVQPALPAGTTGLRFTSQDLRPGDTLWFYELVLKADDFTQ